MRRGQLRLLFCIKALNNPGGGAERVFADVVNGLAERGHEVTALTFEEPGGRSFYPIAGSVPRIDLGIGSTTGKATVVPTLRRIGSLRGRILAHEPDVVIAFMHSMFLPLGLALAGTGVPVIASEHIVPQHYRDRPLQRVLLQTAPRLVDVITCVSEQARDLFPQRLQAIMRVVPNPVVMKVGARADVLGESGHHKTLLSIGRLTDQKDHATLIRAFAEIADDVPDWRMKIVGEGELEEQLRALVASTGLADRIELPGAEQDIARSYANSQLFVLPSLYESFGLTLIEALAHGLPCVGFADCPGVNELIEHETNGILVQPKPDRVTALANTLKGVMLDAGTRRRLASAPFSVPEKYRLPNVLDAWETLIDWVRARRGAARKSRAARLGA